METLETGGLQFEVRRSDRRQTLGLTVDRAGDLIAYAPRTTSADELSRWINTKLLWIHRKLAQKEACNPPSPAPEFVAGEAFFYLGRRYRLKLVDRQDLPLRFSDGWFLLKRDAPSANACFRQWYRARGREWLNRRVESLSRRTSTQPSRIEVRELGFRWGSCSHSGTLNFNWKLMQLPPRFIDYVVAHELIHLREHHHQPTFWQALEHAMPDWRERKDELDRFGRTYLVFGLES